MCGIVGLFTYKLENDTLDPRVKSIIQRMLFVESLVHMETRGKDATGAALLWSDNKTAVLKQPVTASFFAKDDGLWGKDYTNPDDEEANFKWLMNTWMRKHPGVILRQALGHVRAGTKGSEYNVHNNHPIIIQKNKPGKGGSLEEDILIGVHNGGIKNDDELFKKHKFDRIGQVDSEIIFQLLYEHRNDFTIEGLTNVFNELEGAYAVMAYNPENTSKVACLREVRPLNAVYIKELGVVALISEKKYMDIALEQYERWRVREANTIYTYETLDGETHTLGKIHEVFPYLNKDWYSETTLDTVESGVFILDLDTIVNNDTVIKDLVKVKYINKPAYVHKTTGVPHTNSCYGSYQAKTSAPSSVTSPRSGGTTIEGQESKSQSPETVSVEIEDLTTYDSSDAVTEATLLEAEIEEDSPSVEEKEETCPFSWDERIAMACEYLYTNEENLKGKLLLTTEDSARRKEILDKYMLPVKNEEDAEIILASFYDIIFPEGFAIGYAEGYEAAVEEAEMFGDNTEQTDDDKQAIILDIEDKLKQREKAVENLVASLRKERETRIRAQEYISSFRPLVKQLLINSKIVLKDGSIDVDKLNTVKKQINCKNESLVEAIQKKVFHIKN